MFRLKVYDGQERLTEIELTSEVVTIGREAGNTILLPDVSVSRRHAQIEPNGNFFLLRDNGSTNGTFVNEALAHVQVLSHGDTVRIGKYLIRVEAGPKKPHETTRVRVEALRLPGRSSRGAALSGVTFAGEPSVTDASRERLLRLYQVQREIAYIDAKQDLQDRALETMLAELQAERGSILTSEQPEAAGATPRFAPVAVRSAKAPKSDKTGAEILIPEELLLEATSSPGGLRGTREAGGPHYLVSPLCERKRMRGVVYVERSASPFSQEDLQFLNALAGLVAISLANAELFMEISLEKEKMQAIFSSLTDGIFVTDREFRIVEANTAATTLLSLERKNVLGRPLFELLAAFQMSPNPEILKTSSPRENAIFHLLRPSADEKDQKPRLLAGALLPYPRGDQETKGVVAVIRDRSDVHRLEALKTQFIGNVAHKLRSPLTVIQGNLSLLQMQGNEPTSVTEVLEEVAHSSRVLAHFVDQFVEYAELEIRSLGSLVSPESVLLKPLLQEILRTLEPPAASKGLTLAERVPADIPPLMARPEHLARAFGQILDNAVKFASQGGQIVVEAQKLDGYVRLDFVDDGPGIPPEEIEAIFYVCHQVDRERTGQVPGAGLGLTIARHIVQEHGGEIQVTSPFGFADHGTKVSVLLPLKEPAAQGPDHEEKTAENSNVDLTTEGVR